MGVYSLNAVYTGKYVYRSALQLLADGYTSDGVYLIDLPGQDQPTRTVYWTASGTAVVG